MGGKQVAWIKLSGLQTCWLVALADTSPVPTGPRSSAPLDSRQPLKPQSEEFANQVPVLEV